MNNAKAAEMLAWQSLAPEEVYEVACHELQARDSAMKASSIERKAVILQTHDVWAYNWLDAHVRVTPVGLWIQEQVESLPVNMSQFAAEARLTHRDISDLKNGKRSKTTLERIQRLALASLDIRSGKSAFVKRK